jgi:hypothetical protein
MNTGFDPVVVAPGLWKTQTATQQMPFRFGGSQVPIHLGMMGRGMPREAVPFQHTRPVMSIRPIRRPPPFMKGSGASASVGDEEMVRIENRIKLIMRHLLSRSKVKGFEDDSDKYSRIQNQLMGVMRLVNVSKERKKQLLKEVLAFAESVGNVSY